MIRYKNPCPAASVVDVLFCRQRASIYPGARLRPTVIAGDVGGDRARLRQDGRASLAPACQGSVPASAQAAPPSQTHQGRPLTMVTVSPDGKNLAGYSPSGNSVIGGSPARPSR